MKYKHNITGKIVNIIAADACGQGNMAGQTLVIYKSENEDSPFYEVEEHKDFYNRFTCESE